MKDWPVRDGAECVCSAVGDLFVGCLTSAWLKHPRVQISLRCFCVELLPTCPRFVSFALFVSRTIADDGRPGLHDNLTRRFIAQ